MNARAVVGGKDTRRGGVRAGVGGLFLRSLVWATFLGRTFVLFFGVFQLIVPPYN